LTHTMQLSTEQFSNLAYWIKDTVPEHRFGMTPYAELEELATELLSDNEGNTYLMGLLGDEPQTHMAVLADTLLKVSRAYAKYSSCYPTLDARDKAKGKKRAKPDWLDKCIEDHLEGIARAQAEAEEISRLERAFKAPAAEPQPAERL